MSFKSLLNKRCSWRRRVNAGVNEYNEMVYSDVIIGEDVACARQVVRNLGERLLVEDKNVGRVNAKYARYYLLPTDIQEGDIIEFNGSETETVRDIIDGGGRNHHLEIYAEATQFVGEADERHE